MVPVFWQKTAVLYPPKQLSWRGACEASAKTLRFGRLASSIVCWYDRMAVRFEIFREGQKLTSFQPVGAVVLGPESVPIAGDVVFKDGVLTANRSDEHAIGIGLLWETGPLGSFHLETTRLQHREQPYNLNIELARSRLMRIVQKREDWNLFDFPKIEKFQQAFNEAQSIFVEALSGQNDDPGRSAALADQALMIALDLSEQLALFHGDLLLNRRRTNGPVVRHIAGCRVDPTIQNQKYRETIAEAFDYAVLPMSWRHFQPDEEEFHTEAVDEWVQFLTSKRLPIIGGPLVHLREQDVPDWMYIWENDLDTFRELTFEYIQKVVFRYRKAVSVWNVVAGLGSNTSFPMSFEQCVELTRLLVMQVKNVSPGARTLVTITHPFGDNRAKMLAGAPPMLYAEMVAQSGINFEGFGVELELGVPSPGFFMRDLFQISCLLDRFSSFGKPVFLTSVLCPSRGTPDPADRSGGKLDPAQGGRWHRPWDPELQADWIEAVYKLAISKPFVENIAWGNVADINQSMPGGGLLDDMLQPKSSFIRLQSIREKLHQWNRRNG